MKLVPPRAMTDASPDADRALHARTCFACAGSCANEDPWKRSDRDAFLLFSRLLTPTQSIWILPPRQCLAIIQSLPDATIAKFDLGPTFAIFASPSRCALELNSISFFLQRWTSHATIHSQRALHKYQQKHPTAETWQCPECDRNETLSWWTRK